MQVIIKSMAKIKAGILRGGQSSEYEISLKTGGAVIEALRLPESKYEPVDILIDKTGLWHLSGAPTMPHKAFQTIDLVFNAMHGEYGEDGKVQQLM